MNKIGSVLTILGSCIGALILIVGFLGANGAPQEAAAGAVGAAFAVVPYCFARALSELSRTKS
jgi:hypothetical protein